MPSKITMIETLYDDCLTEAGNLEGVHSLRYKLLIDRMTWLMEWKIELHGGQENVVAFGR